MLLYVLNPGDGGSISNRVDNGCLRPIRSLRCQKGVMMRPHIIFAAMRLPLQIADKAPWLDRSRRHIVILLDGAADVPQDVLGGLTPLQAARTPELDRLANLASGADPSIGEQPLLNLFRSIPEGCYAGSEVANLTILGYADLAREVRGRAALEARALGIELDDSDVAYRCDLDELPPLPLPRTLGRILPGLGHRHIYIPAVGCPLSGDDRQTALLWEERLNEYLSHHGIRSSCRLWSPSARLPQAEPFVGRHGMDGAVVAAVPVIRGIGLYLGMYTPIIVGATGDIDTDLRAKADAALALSQRYPFVFVHIEAADEASHRCNPEEKRDVLSRVDAELIGSLAYGASTSSGEWRYDLTILCDHYTDSSTGLHLRRPVPYIYIPSTYL